MPLLSLKKRGIISSKRVASMKSLHYRPATEDNLPAQALYRKAGYALIEVGPCTTADGNEQVGYTFEKCL